jgi:hypothetical protein
MQTTAHELDGAGYPASTEPDLDTHLTPEEADAIFTLAEAEIQPILRKMGRERFVGWVQGGLCVSLILFSLGGIVWQCITYPHTLIVLYTKARPASITATLDVPTRTLAPVTITRSATVPTTGHGHQDARAATGTLIFYNGSATPQYVPVGSVFTGNDGVKVTTEHGLTVPAANLPAIGSIRVVATALLPGRHGNIAAFDVDVALSPILKVRNEAPFTNGRDAREYQAVASQDLQTLTSTANETVTQAFTTAFPLQQGETALPAQCHTATSTNYQIGQEAQWVTVTASKTCSAVAYNSQQLHRQAASAFTHTKPGARYHINGNVLTAVQNVFPFSVTIKWSWSFTFSTDYEQLLAQQIAGDTPAQARRVLLRTGVISSASIPDTLPPESMYIDFLVLS